MAAHRLTTALLKDEAELRELLGEPTPLVQGKLSDRLNPTTRPFIERSPFLCLATCRTGAAVRPWRLRGRGRRSSRTIIWAMSILEP